MKILDIHPTPNPSAIKFIVDRPLTSASESVSSESSDDPSHPLLREIMKHDRVETAFIHGTWITIRFDSAETKSDRDVLKSVADVIREHDAPKPQTNETAPLESEDPRLMLIRDVIESKVLPYLHSHGGSVEIVGLENDLVLIRYMGACGGCPASTTATLHGIESLLKVEVDPELEVQLV